MCSSDLSVHQRGRWSGSRWAGPGQDSSTPAGAGGAPGPILTHSGSNTMWYCVAWLAPARGLAVLVTTNAGHPPAPRACDEAAEALLQLAGPR